MRPDWTLHLAIAPEGASARLAKAIKLRPKRAFGVLKTQNEYIGLVEADAFEIWERTQRAVHLVGRIAKGPGGTRIEMRFLFPTRTRVLLVAFVALYVLASLGIALRPPEGVITVEEVLIAIAGAAVLGTIWTASTLRQRADLRAFVEGVFSEVPRVQSRP